MIEYPQPVPRPATLAERMRAAGINDERALAAITQGRVRVGEDVVTDPEHPTPWPTGWVVLPSS
ncbi:hypothetical protein [Actinomycetospora termitidis]|uniref:Uncharacterized protein n=1 Tax=Actinomycetospora termitidis TaxID=3053470 RepID=A0ABT7MIC6_9PSEU|nr:hypothetical protein [Actinomycetospora sp. Odt1-22]MDL5160434.1 hypothetical protein [Actinomycetospora sp. Odt1-22]